MNKIKNVLTAEAGKHAALLIRVLDSLGIRDWADISTTAAVRDIRDAIDGACNSGSVYAARLASTLGKYADQLPNLPRDWRKNLVIKAKKSQQTFLSMDDIRKLFAHKARSVNEERVILSAIIELRTGARISDTKDLDERNEVEGMLNYVSKKTGVEAFLPSSPELLRVLKLRRAITEDELTDEGNNKALKRILGDAGITDEVKLYRRGEYREEEKAQALASHSMRRTFCTQLHLSGEDVVDIMSWAGHSSVDMTVRYIRAHRKPSAPRWNYFEVIDNLIAERYPSADVGENSPLSKLDAVEKAIL